MKGWRQENGRMGEWERRGGKAIFMSPTLPLSHSLYPAISECYRLPCFTGAPGRGLGYPIGPAGRSGADLI